MIEHPDINGHRASMPVPYHRGRDLRQGLLKALIRRFSLPNDIFG
jgi:predicted RNA binding protein YcfA (HicA-like mRNA interferase family)